MEKWVGTIIGAVFIVALGYAVYVFFGGKSLAKGGSDGKNDPGLIGRMGDGVEAGCHKVLADAGLIKSICPQCLFGVYAGFVNVLSALVS